jgi:hypothetical protein
MQNSCQAVRVLREKVPGIREDDLRAEEVPLHGSARLV